MNASPAPEDSHDHCEHDHSHGQGVFFTIEAIALVAWGAVLTYYVASGKVTPFLTTTGTACSQLVALTFKGSRFENPIFSNNSGIEKLIGMSDPFYITQIFIDSTCCRQIIGCLLVFTIIQRGMRTFIIRIFL